MPPKFDPSAVVVGTLRARQHAPRGAGCAGTPRMDGARWSDGHGARWPGGLRPRRCRRTHGHAETAWSTRRPAARKGGRRCEGDGGKARQRWKAFAADVLCCQPPINGTKTLIARRVLALPATARAVNLRVTGGEVPGGSSLAPKIGPLGLVRARAFAAEEELARCTPLANQLRWTAAAPGGCTARLRACAVGPQNPKKVGDDIAKATSDWKGLRVTVALTIQNRVATVKVIPSASSLIVKALKEPPRDRKKVKNGTWPRGRRQLPTLWCVVRVANATTTVVPSRGPVLRLAVKHDGNIPLSEIFAIARVMRDRSMAREFVGTVKEILGTAQSVGCTVDGQNPHTIIEKIDAGQIEVPSK